MKTISFSLLEKSLAEPRPETQRENIIISWKNWVIDCLVGDRLGRTQAGLMAETSQRVYQKLHSAAANRYCDVVPSTRWGFIFISFSDKSRGRQAGLLHGSSLMSSETRPLLSSSGLQNGCWGSSNHIHDSGRKKEEKRNEQRGSAHWDSPL